MPFGSNATYSFEPLPLSIRTCSAIPRKLFSQRPILKYPTSPSAPGTPTHQSERASTRQAATSRTPIAQGAFLDLGGSIGIILLDTVWARTAWDGAIRANAHEVESSASGSFEGKGVQQISPRAWQNLEFELGRDSEFRLLIVAVRVRKHQHQYR